MRNMKIKAKLLTGFIIVAILAGLVGVVGIIGITKTSSDAQLINDRNSVAIEGARLNKNVQEQRAAYRGAALKAEINQMAESQADLELLKSLETTYVESYAHIEEGLVAEEGKALYSKIGTAYQSYKSALDSFVTVIDNAAAETPEKKTEVLNGLTDPVDELASSVSALVDYLNEETNIQTAEANAFGRTMSVIMIIVVVVACVIAVLLGFVMASLIATPISRIVKVADAVAIGDIDVNVEVNSKDEVGILSASFKSMIAAIQQQAQILQTIASGDFRVDVPIRSDKDVMNKAIDQMSKQNNKVLLDIREAATQVSAGAGQIATGAQTLATGTSEQAATVEEFSATMNEIEAKIKQSAEDSHEGNEVINEAGRLMTVTTASMGDMTNAMNEIDESSQSITKVIKVIDDIAFQTNILALNAAVEAARAGQHGKGFAVVADEVRNLASKSAEAAKETASLIEGSSIKVAEGNTIVENTNESMGKVADAAARSAELMAQINQASQEQSKAVAEVTVGIGQISDVIQANSATAEESAAAAEELSAQATMLEEILAQFKLRESGNVRMYNAAPAKSAPSAAPAIESRESVPQIDLGGDFDKY